jgi:hypothetical protein
VGHQNGVSQSMILVSQLLEICEDTYDIKRKKTSPGSYINDQFLPQGSTMTNGLISHGFQLFRLQADFMVVKTILFAHTNFL